jgi:hypothetical protein
VNLWKNIKVQAALALFVAAAFTQLAQAGVRPDNRPLGPRAGVSAASSMPSQKALDAVGARWNAIAESYGARPASSYYTQSALDAMGQRNQAQAPFDSGALFPNSDPSSPGYVPGADFSRQLHTALGQLDTYVPGVTDFPTTVADPGSTSDQPTVIVADEGFDWSDAGIGAAGVLGTCLLLAGCALVAASHRKHKPAVL